MKANYQLTETEVVSALKIHSRGSNKAWAILAIGLFFILLIGILAEQTFIAVAAIIGGIATYFVVLHLIIPYQAKKQFKEYRVLREHAHLETSDKGIHFENQSGKSDLPWADFHYWKFAHGIYLLYITSNLFYIIPARAISDLEIMNTLLIDNIGKRKS